MLKKIVLLCCLSLVLTACVLPPKNRDDTKPLQTVDHVDINRYAGTWYEIARLENSFERNCKNVTATYETIEKSGNKVNKISVVNVCEKIESGKTSRAEGSARIVSKNNAKLKVRFAPKFVPFAEGDYWVLYLRETTPDAPYQTSLVGDPSGRFLWILNREPMMNDEDLKTVLLVAKGNGYDTGKLHFTIHDNIK